MLTKYKKCVQIEQLIKKSKLLNACIYNNGDIFKEIKDMRRVKPKNVDTIDGEKHNLPNHFKKIYETLYNSVDDAEDVAIIAAKVENNIKEGDSKDVEKIDEGMVKRACQKLKPGKGDTGFTFSSDCVKIDSPTLWRALGSIIRGFLYHGFIPISSPRHPNPNHQEQVR